MGKFISIIANHEIEHTVSQGPILPVKVSLDGWKISGLHATQSLGSGQASGTKKGETVGEFEFVLLGAGHESFLSNSLGKSKLGFDFVFPLS